MGVLYARTFTIRKYARAPYIIAPNAHVKEIAFIALSMHRITDGVGLDNVSVSLSPYKTEEKNAIHCRPSEISKKISVVFGTEYTKPTGTDGIPTVHTDGTLLNGDSLPQND